MFVCGGGLAQQRVGEFRRGRQPAPSIRHLANEQRTRGEKEYVSNFHLTYWSLRLSQEPALMTLNLRTKEKVIYYCCTSSSSFTMHIVNMKITLAEDHVQ